MKLWQDLCCMKHLSTFFSLFALFTASKIGAQTPQQLQEVDTFVQQQQRKNHLPGLAVGIVHNGRIVFAKGYGKTSTAEAITPHTPFAIASLSKAFTAAAVLQLAEKGKVNIDLPAVTYIHSLPPQLRSITVRELLNQTSGLSDKIFPELKFKQQPPDLDAAIGRLANVQLKDKPGTKFQYHNPNYQLLAKVVETASGQSFNDYLKRHLLRPLQMNETEGFTSTEDFYKSGLTNGHGFLLGHAYAMKEPEWFVAGAAGMISSVNDIVKWMIFNLQNDNRDSVLTAKSVRLMQSVPTSVKSSYGMGWIVGSDSTVSHSGILWTYQSDLKLMQKQGYGIVVLFNAGLNGFQDYSAFTSGISSIVSNEAATVNSTFLWGYWAIAAFVIIVLVCAVIRFKMMSKWKSKATQASKIGHVINITLRLVPLLILLLVPTLLTAISGRVLSWQRMFYAMPEVVLWLVFWAIFNLSVIVARLNTYKKVFSQGKI